MARRLTQIQQSTVETVYETIAAMLPPGDLCEQIWLPDLIRGLGLEDSPQTIWQAIRELLSAEVIELRFVAPNVKLSDADERLLIRGPKIGEDGERMRLGYIRLAGGTCGKTGCDRVRTETIEPYPPLCCVDALTGADLEVIKIGTSKKSSRAKKQAADEQRAAREGARSCKVNLTEYDLIAVNSSGGKDSQAMLDAVMRKCCELGITERVRVYHGDLKDVEWAGSMKIAEVQARYYGVPFSVGSNERHEDLLARVSDRGEWPSGGAVSRQYCTSEFKRQPINKMFTAWTNEFWDRVELDLEAKLRQMVGSQREVDKLRRTGTKSPISAASAYRNYMAAVKGKKVDLEQFRPKILNCIGVRAEESKARAKKSPLTSNSKLHGSNSRKRVDTWFPIFTWTRRQVWEVIAASGVPHHWAYDLGMPRLSCVFCVMGNQAALAIGAEYNPELFQRYIALEDSLQQREPLVCGANMQLKPGCTLTAKAKREKGDTLDHALALDAQGSCPIDYEQGMICVPIEDEMQAWREGRRKEKPTITPARKRQWRFGMNMSIREVAERIRRCKEDPTLPECKTLREDPDVDSFL